MSFVGPSCTIAYCCSAVVAHPTEVIKCRLQLQMLQPANAPKQYSGPFDVVRQTYQALGTTGMWRGVGSSFIYRTCFAAMFGGQLAFMTMSWS